VAYFFQEGQVFAPCGAAASRIALCGIKFCFRDTLGRESAILDLARPPREKKLPPVRSVAEVRQIPACVHRQPYRVCLSTIYSCGLRLQEGVHLQVRDIDSDRMVVHVRQGKGARDRYVPLPAGTLQMRRQYWRTHRHAVWLGAARTRAGAASTAASAPRSVSAVQRALQSALAESVVRKPATVHSCATVVPPTYSKPGSTCGSFKSTWGTIRSRAR
jgi:integrase/recombinase XerD